MVENIFILDEKNEIELENGERKNREKRRENRRVNNMWKGR